MSDEAVSKLDRYDPRVKAAIRDFFRLALGTDVPTGISPHYVIGVFMGACDLPEAERERFRQAFERHRDTLWNATRGLP